MYTSPIQLAASLVEMLPIHVLEVRPSNLSKEYSLAHIIDGLRWRSSSRSGDQAIVASLLMHLNVANKTVPWTIIFDRRPKMKRAGFYMGSRNVDELDTRHRDCTRESY